MQRLVSQGWKISQGSPRNCLGGFPLVFSGRNPNHYVTHMRLERVGRMRGCLGGHFSANRPRSFSKGVGGQQLFQRSATVVLLDEPGVLQHPDQHVFQDPCQCPQVLDWEPLPLFGEGTQAVRAPLPRQRKPEHPPRPCRSSRSWGPACSLKFASCSTMTTLRVAHAAQDEEAPVPTAKCMSCSAHCPAQAYLELPSDPEKLCSVPWRAVRVPPVT